jgi:hypothetical protein
MDNRYYKYGCPPLMQDARFMTNYLPDRTVEQYIRLINNIDSAQEYRAFLQRNGDTIMNREREYVTAQNTCSIQGQCAPISNNGQYVTIVKFEK